MFGMFGIGFWELVLILFCLGAPVVIIGIVAIVVLAARGGRERRE